MLAQETTDSTTRLISILSLCVAMASFVISGLSLAFTVVTHRKLGRRIKVRINYWRKEDKTEEFRLSVHNYGSEDIHISRWWIQGKQGVRQRIGASTPTVDRYLAAGGGPGGQSGAATVDDPVLYTQPKIRRWPQATA
jgi:hypothetical protein